MPSRGPCLARRRNVVYDSVQITSLVADIDRSRGAVAVGSVTAGGRAAVGVVAYPGATAAGVLVVLVDDLDVVVVGNPQGVTVGNPDGVARIRAGIAEGIVPTATAAPEAASEAGAV